MNGSLSEHKAGDRMFKLYLPPSYSTDSSAFPSVYVQDGGSLFQDQLELIENRFHQNSVPELVLIGIEPKNRLDEYTPWPAASLSDQFPDFGGKGADYLSEITNRLIPFVEENWNVSRRAQSRGMIGASLGGLISMFAFLRHSSLFGKIGSLSSSYWYENAAETIYTSSVRPGSTRIFMSVGSEEGAGKQSIQDDAAKNKKRAREPKRKRIHSRSAVPRH